MIFYLYSYFIHINNTYIQMENLNNDCEKLQKANNKLQKICDNLEDEKLYLQSELNRLSKDVELRYDK